MNVSFIMPLYYYSTFSSPETGHKIFAHYMKFGTGIDKIWKLVKYLRT